MADKAYTVESIVDSRVNSKKETEYQVKWQGYPEPTWEKAANLEEDVPDLIEQFKSSEAGKRKRDDGKTSGDDAPPLKRRKTAETTELAAAASPESAPARATRQSTLSRIVSGASALVRGLTAAVTSPSPSPAPAPAAPVRRGSSGAAPAAARRSSSGATTPAAPAPARRGSSAARSVAAAIAAVASDDAGKTTDTPIASVSAVAEKPGRKGRTAKTAPGAAAKGAERAKRAKAAKAAPAAKEEGGAPAKKTATKRAKLKKGYFIVSKVLGERVVGGKKEYQVKWVGWPGATWEPADVITEDVPDLVAQYTGVPVAASAEEPKESKKKKKAAPKKKSTTTAKSKGTTKSSTKAKGKKASTTKATKTSTKKASTTKAATGKRKRAAKADDGAGGDDDDDEAPPAKKAKASKKAAATPAPKASKPTPAVLPLATSAKGRKRAVNAKVLKAAAAAAKGGKAAATTPKVKKTRKVKKLNVDQVALLKLPGAHVYKDYDCALNQTNIEFNNNKYYLIQLLEKDGKYYLWTRWGRVGLEGQNALKGQPNVETAIHEFGKKFLAKTLNAWEERDRFRAHHRKYTLLERDNEEGDDGEEEEVVEEEEEEDAAAVAAATSTGQKMLFQGKFPNGQLLYIAQCDLADIEADAIVHPTNASFSTGGQVGNALSQAGGAAFRKALDAGRASGGIPSSGAKITAAGDLPAKWVIHVNSPHYEAHNRDQSGRDLAKTIASALAVANSNGVESVAFPSIGSGVNGFPKDFAAATILTAIGEFFKSHEGATLALKEVYFVLYDATSMALYTSQFQSITSGLAGALGRTASSIQVFS